MKNEICFSCGKECVPSRGMNFGAGAIFWCKECCPPKPAEEVIEEIKNFIEPPKERAV